jgi:hypothetical protein
MVDIVSAAKAAEVFSTVGIPVPHQEGSLPMGNIYTFVTSVLQQLYNWLKIP